MSIDMYAHSGIRHQTYIIYQLFINQSAAISQKLFYVDYLWSGRGGCVNKLSYYTSQLSKRIQNCKFKGRQSEWNRMKIKTI